MSSPWASAIANFASFFGFFRATLKSLTDWFDRVRGKVRRATSPPRSETINQGDVIITTKKDVCVEFTLTFDPKQSPIRASYPLYFSHAVIGVIEKSPDHYGDLFILIPEESVGSDQGLSLLVLDGHGPLVNVQMVLSEPFPSWQSPRSFFRVEWAQQPKTIYNTHASAIPQSVLGPDLTVPSGYALFYAYVAAIIEENPNDEDEIPVAIPVASESPESEDGSSPFKRCC